MYMKVIVTMTKNPSMRPPPQHAKVKGVVAPAVVATAATNVRVDVSRSRNPKNVAAVGAGDDGAKGRLANFSGEEVVEAGGANALDTQLQNRDVRYYIDDQPHSISNIFDIDNYSGWITLFKEEVYKAVVPENALPGTVLTQFLLTDLDSDKSEINNLNIAGNNHSRLEIGKTGELLVHGEVAPVYNLSLVATAKVAKAIDRETRSKYVLLAHAQDGQDLLKECLSEIIITVNDLNDNSPVFSMPQYIVSIPEDAQVQTLVTKVHATDEDFGLNRKISYSFLDQNHPFNICESNGIVMLSKSLDRENISVFNISIRAEDHGEPKLLSTANLIVNVLDINDNPPEFSLKEYQVHIPENAPLNTKVAKVFATSKDIGVNAEIMYFIVGGDEQKKFNIDSRTGTIFVNGELDYERTKSYILTIQAIDGGSPPLSNTAPMNISIIDVNDYQPKFLKNVYRVKVQEDISVGEHVLQVLATDEDSQRNAVIRICTDLGNSSFKCTCHARFTGQICELDLDPCASSPCLFGGRCQYYSPSNYSCDCPTPLSGNRCEFGKFCSPSPCKNGGICEEGDGVPHCMCRGYSGPTCDVDVNECENMPCGNGATCINEAGSFRCICPSYLTGASCGDPLYTNSISTKLKNFSIEHVTGIISGVTIALLLMVIILCIIVVRRNSFHRNRNNSTNRKNLYKEENLNSLIEKKKLYKQNPKLSNLEVNHRPTSYTQTTGESTIPSNTRFVNNLDILRSYGSAGDELETIAFEYQKINRTGLQIYLNACNLNETEVTDKQNWCEQMHLKTFSENKLNNDTNLGYVLPLNRIASLKPPCGRLIEVAMPNVCHTTHAGEFPTFSHSQYHWDCSDWVRKSHNSLPDITEVPVAEIVDSSSFHSNDSNESKPLSSYIAQRNPEEARSLRKLSYKNGSNSDLSVHLCEIEDSELEEFLPSETRSKKQ